MFWFENLHGKKKAIDFDGCRVGVKSWLAHQYFNVMKLPVEQIGEKVKDAYVSTSEQYSLLKEKFETLHKNSEKYDNIIFKHSKDCSYAKTNADGIAWLILWGLFVWISLLISWLWARTGIGSVSGLFVLILIILGYPFHKYITLPITNYYSRNSLAYGIKNLITAFYLNKSTFSQLDFNAYEKKFVDAKNAELPFSNELYEIYQDSKKIIDELFEKESPKSPAELCSWLYKDLTILNNAVRIFYS